MDALLIVMVVVVIVGAIAYGYYAAEKRRKELLNWTQAHQLTFDPTKAYDLDNRFPQFKRLQQGANRYAHNVMQGSWKGRDFLGFDYHYETYSTDSKGRRQTHHHHFSAVILSSDMPLKPLQIRPEGIFDKITEFFGFDDIDFESAEFSRAFHVSAQDRRWAYDVLHARAMQFLLDQPRFSLQMGEHTVIVHRSRTFAPDEFGIAAEVVCGLLDGLPEYVVQQQKTLKG